MSTSMIGSALSRVDGPAKATGAARYAAEFSQPGQAFAVVVGASVGLGRVTAINDAAVAAMPGVVAVVTARNAPQLPYRPHRAGIDPAVGERLHVLQDDRVRFYGQPVAVVVAETLDQAERGAAALRVDYVVEHPMVDPADPRAAKVAPAAASLPDAHVVADKARGDADAALAAAEIRVDVAFDIARQNHNPMEPHATVAAWSGDRLTLWSKSQFVVNERAEIAAVFGLPPENVHVICPFIGGAFGTSLRTWPHVTLAALAAKVAGRPVKLALTRRQMFFTTGHRPRTLQRVALGAARDGRLTAIVHEGAQETSRYEEFVEALLPATSYMYACPNVRTAHRLCPLDTSTPTYMRAPGESSGMHALECAMDELAYALGVDPLELRRRNEPEIDKGEGKPFSSRSLTACYDLGAERFGWARRNPAPRSMRDGRLLIGMGMASATYPVLHFPASARVRLKADGGIDVEAAASDMGPGTYTSMTQVAAETLGVPAETIRFLLGDSDLPPTPPHGGSMTMASVGSAVRAACLAAQAEAARRAGSGVAGADYAGIAAAAGGEIVAEATVERDPEAAGRFSMHSFGAVFVEVSVDADLGEIRVRRAVGAYAAGRIVNTRLAASQCVGGIVGGIGMALMERTVLDPRDGRPINAHMADYLVPVNLDVPPIEAHFVEERDAHVNPLGVKGLGEIALVGVAPAIANAVFHATGRRVRHLPIVLEDVLEG